MITHYDLFAGIGGFSLALEEVFTNEKIKHVFCEWESFPTAVLRQRWPDGEFWGDIADLVTHTASEGLQGELHGSGEVAEGSKEATWSRGRNERNASWSIVTGGFPCQPFSHAGRRKGTADPRYQWPNMFEVIRNIKPEWVIAENVRGLVTWSEGMVLEQVCSDLESEGYEVQPFIIPAVAVNAPHRRDRVWIIANRSSERWEQRGHNRGRGSVLPDENRIATQSDTPRGGRISGTTTPNKTPADTAGGILTTDTGSKEPRRLPQQSRETGAEDRAGNINVADTSGERWEPGSNQEIRSESSESERPDNQYPDWERNWQEVAFATCDESMVDGLPRLVDGVSYSYAKWRAASLKAYGNGIVHQVATEIMQAIKESI